MKVAAVHFTGVRCVFGLKSEPSDEDLHAAVHSADGRKLRQLKEHSRTHVVTKCGKIGVSSLFVVSLRDMVQVPDVFVVPGSSGHNSRSGTRAFRVAVVRWVFIGGCEMFNWRL